MNNGLKYGWILVWPHSFSSFTYFSVKSFFTIVPKGNKPFSFVLFTSRWVDDHRRRATYNKKKKKEEQTTSSILLFLMLCSINSTLEILNQKKKRKKKKRKKKERKKKMMIFDSIRVRLIYSILNIFFLLYNT